MQRTPYRAAARALSAALLLIVPLQAGAQTYDLNNPIYSVSIDTAPLTQAPLVANGSFTLDFQLVQGDQSYSDSVKIFNFAIGAGTWSGMPQTIGDASGSTGPGFMLGDSNFFNEVQQGFNPGNTLSFDVASTFQPFTGSVPDEFSFSILDGSGNEIPTSPVVNGQSASSNALLVEDFDPTLNVYQATGPYAAIGTPTVTFPSSTPPSVPEPSGLLGTLLFGSGLLTRSVFRRHKVVR